jgi:hypothetical protein
VVKEVPAQVAPASTRPTGKMVTSEGWKSERTADEIAAIERIRAEGLERSQVMDTLDYLTNVIGPRLTGSPQLKRANEWARDQFVAWGLPNAALEQWGPFGRGWSLERFSMQVVSPDAIVLNGYPKAWFTLTPAGLTSTSNRSRGNSRGRWYSSGRCGRWRLGLSRWRRG